MPSYSRGCRRCVERKIKCDERRPVCLRCEVSNLVCDGPPHPSASRFLDETQRVTARATRKRPRPSPQQLSPIRISRSPDSVEVAIISPTAYSTDTYTVFLLDKVLQYGTWNAQLQNNRAWIYEALQSPTDRPISNAALKATSHMFFACVNRDPMLQEKSLDLYGSALSKLSKALQHLREPTFDIMSAVLLLQMFDFAAAHNTKGWMQHMHAFRNLISLAGPAYFQQEPQKSLLTWQRFPLLVESHVTFQRDFMEEPQWQSLLKPNGTSAFNLGMRLTDIAYHISGLLSDIDANRADPMHFSDDKQKLKETLDALKQVEKRFDSWNTEWTLSPDRVPVRTENIPSDLVTNPLNNIFLRYPHLDAAAIPCRYHAHNMLLLTWLAKIEAKLTFLSSSAPGTEGSSSQTKSYLAKNSDWRRRQRQRKAHANAIIETLPYYCLPQYVYIAATYVGVPVVAAASAFEKGSREAIWIQGMLDALADRSGFESARYLIRDFA